MIVTITSVNDLQEKVFGTDEIAQRLKSTLRYGSNGYLIETADGELFQVNTWGAISTLCAVFIMCKATGQEMYAKGCTKSRMCSGCPEHADPERVKLKYPFTLDVQDDVVHVLEGEVVYA